MDINKYKLIPVGLALVVLITLRSHSDNLTAIPSAAENDSQKIELTEHCDRLLTEARQLQSKGHYKDALANLEKAYKLATELNSSIGIVSVLVQMSDLYLNVGRIDQAKKLGQQALEMVTRLEHQPKLMASVLNNWGNILTLARDGNMQNKSI